MAMLLDFTFSDRPVVPEATWTLTRFFEEFVWPELLAPARRSEGTRKEYRIALKHWQQGTNDPQIQSIDRATPAQFLRYLFAWRKRAALSSECKDEQELSVTTIRKIIREIQFLLDRTGPAGPGNREGQNLVPTPAWIKPPPAHQFAPRHAFTLQELDRLLIAARSARPSTVIPEDIPAPVWWRALILLGYNTGMRPGSLLAARHEHIDDHWLVIPPEAIKCHNGQRLWLNRHALAAVKSTGRKKGLILPWLATGAATLCRQWGWLQTAAGLKRSGSHTGMYALRRAFATQCAAIDPLAAQIMLNHRGLGMAMMINHYVNPEKLLSKALAKLPQPPETRVTKQRRRRRA